MKFSILHVNMTEKENYLHVNINRKLTFELFTCQYDKIESFTCQFDRDRIIYMSI